MPIPTNSRNAILGQLDAAFAALEAGQSLDSFLHTPIQFSTGGRTYIAVIQGGGDDVYSYLTVRIKRMPL